MQLPKPDKKILDGVKKASKKTKEEEEIKESLSLYGLECWAEKRQVRICDRETDVCEDHLPKRPFPDI